ncbi:MAG TPA: FecR family protein [Steroidobacter sp.]
MRDRVSKLPQPILDEAAHWFVDFREGEVDAKRREQFNAWLRRSPEHIRAYIEVSAFWADVPLLMSGREVSIDELIAYAESEDNVVRMQRGAARQDTAPTPANLPSNTRIPGGANQAVRRLVLRPRLSLVASIVTGCVIAVLAWYSMQTGQTYSTGIGEQRSILLEDGSTVQLNARSSVEVRFDERSRDVTLLAGQALFKVAKDHDRPFVVHSGNVHVQAIGTEFDVYRRKAGTTVTVLEGRVAVLSSPVRALEKIVGEEPAVLPDADVQLAAGQQVRVAPEGSIELPTEANIAAASAWTRRQLVFQRTPLTEVVEEFNRYNRRQMIIDDATIGAVRISGVFSSTDPTSLLHFLRAMPMFSVYETDEEIRIVGRDPPSEEKSG